MHDQVDERLRARLTAALDAVPLTAPDPAAARYRRARPAWAMAAVRGPALGLVAGVAATIVVAAATTASPQPGVWVQRAAGCVQQIEDSLVSAPVRPTDESSPAPSPPPAAAAIGPVRPTPSAEHPPAAPPSAAARPQESGEHRASPAAVQPTRRPSPSPSPTADDTH